MKIIVELDILQSCGGLNDKDEAENIARHIKKHFTNNCSVIDGEVTYYRNLGNVWGNPDLIVKLQNVEVAKK